MKEEHRPTIEALEAQLKDLELKVAAKKKTINDVCELAEIAPLYPDVNVPDHRVIGTLLTDQFYGKSMTTATREYMEIRKASKRGPAAPREIYEALVTGGFKFETKSEINALTSLRQTLRKNSSIFHRLPNNQYGLLIWYPNAKVTKGDIDDGGEDAAVAAEAPSRRSAKRATKAPKGHQHKAPPLEPFISEAMDDGSKWTTERLKQEAIVRAIPGIDASTKKHGFHTTLLLLKRRGIVTQVAKGTWQKVGARSSSSSPPGEVVPIKGAAA